ncbi:MAG: NAD-dependent succinate-semialdehyde dehydrogenase [Gammaproteobacteria bacterium]|nr:NAD-dependent succinate-semialdehyde dehydrogenase [Gammaproteobacteria bacterium]
MSYPQPQLFVGGEWLAATSTGAMPVLNPGDGQTLAHLPIAGDRELRAAANAAGGAFRGWSALLPLERQRIIARATQLLRERAPHVAEVLTLEQGKPLAEAQREVALAADIIDFLAEEARRLPIRGVPPRLANIASQTVTRVPVGPVAAFTPWNFPANLPARKIGGALAAGCTVIIKPSEETPATCMELVRAFADAGLPHGVLNLVAGQPAQISAFLIAEPAIAKLSFTGSVPVGRQLGELAARHLKRYTAELGGHAPAIIAADVDPLAVARLAVAAKFRNAGQVCASPIRFLVQRALYERFRDAFVAETLKIKVGPGLDPESRMGPLIHERRISEMQRFVDDARAHGARVLTGGVRLDRPGFFYAPTVLERVPATARAQREEPFGPIALLDSYDTVDEALERSNALPYGLAAYAFTNDLKLSQRLSAGLVAGMVGINHFGISQPETPFGGVKESGFGSESGLEGLLGYTDVKLVSVAS